MCINCTYKGVYSLPLWCHWNFYHYFISFFPLIAQIWWEFLSNLLDLTNEKLSRCMMHVYSRVEYALLIVYICWLWVYMTWVTHGLVRICIYELLPAWASDQWEARGSKWLTDAGVCIVCFDWMILCVCRSINTKQFNCYCLDIASYGKQLFCISQK